MDKKLIKEPVKKPKMRRTPHPKATILSESQRSGIWKAKHKAITKLTYSNQLNIEEQEKFDLNEFTIKPLYTKEFTFNVKSFIINRNIPQLYFPENL